MMLCSIIINATMVLILFMFGYRTFEMQLMPNLINTTKLGLHFSSVVVYSCLACSTDNGQGAVVVEHVVIENEL